MDTISEKLEYINKEIKNTNLYFITDFNNHLKNAKEIKYKFYSNNRNKLKNIDSNTILKHNFQSEVLDLAEILEKKVVINKIISMHHIKIKRHRYAPELNKVLFLSEKTNKYKEIDAPNVVEISKTITVRQKLENHKAINLRTFLSSKSISYLNNILIL